MTNIPATMNTVADRIFVINLKERTDRYEQFTNEFKNEGITNWERFDAIRFSPDNSAYQQYLPAFHNFCAGQGKDQRYLKAAFGCMLSHYLCILQAKQRGYKSVMIMEDDVQFIPGWKDNFAITWEELTTKYPKWNMFYFHMGYYSPYAFAPLSDNLVIPAKGLGGTCYIVKAELYDFILSRMLVYARQLDVFYLDCLQNRPTTLAVRKNIVQQRESWSDIEFNLANIGGR